MTNKDIKLRGRTTHPHAAYASPDFVDRTVLSADTWDYVHLWLRRNDQDEATFFWDQARQFYRATEGLSETASPLTSYYCCLNASKALLLVKSQSFSEEHGIKGKSTSAKTALVNEEVTILQGGVLPALARFLGDTVSNNETYNLNRILYNLPFVHRAYCLTFKSAADLFLPLNDPKFVLKDDSTEAWFCATIDPRHVRSNLSLVLPPPFEIDAGVSDHCVVRRKKRFAWQGKPRSLQKDLTRLTTYHSSLRRNIVPIISSPNRWYMRKAIDGALDKAVPTLIFAALHRLSALARYQPDRLSRHLDCQHNWLLSEFLRLAPTQFIGFAAAEITGKEFVSPYASGAA